MKTGRALISKTITMMTEDAHRNQRIAKELKRLLEEGRCIIATSDRTNHLALMKEALLAEGVDEESIGIFKGETSKKRIRQRDVEKERPILLATYSMASEGFDKPQLDTLAMMTPKSNIEQVVGRILRTCAGKKSPSCLTMWTRTPAGP